MIMSLETCLLSNIYDCNNAISVREGLIPISVFKNRNLFVNFAMVGCGLRPSGRHNR